MPSLALATGAGAADGLEEMLGRMRAEEQLARQGAAQEASVRHNRVQEDYQNRALEENAALRRATQSSLDSDRKERQAATFRDDVRQREQLRVPGTKVSPEDYNEVAETRAIPLSSYESRQDLAAETGRPEDQGPTEEPNTIFKGLRSTTAERRPANRQLKTVVLDGQPVDASWAPDEDKYYYKGQDVTDKVKHYTAPDRSVVQVYDEGVGDNVYTPRSGAAGRRAPMDSATRTMSNGARMLEPHIRDLKTQAMELENRGLFGPIMSRVRHLGETVGSLDEFYAAIAEDPTLKNDPLVGKFSTSLGLLATGAGRVHGGARGGGSPQMLKHFQHLLSDSSSVEMFLGRLDAIDDYMGTYAAGPQAIKPEESHEPSTGGDDAYEEYLRMYNAPANPR